ncbi:Eukaryotic translation initiation factor 5B [Linum perenne]
MGRKKPAARGGDDDNPPAVPQGGGGKSKKKTLVIDDDEYSVGTELSEEPQVEEEKPVITGKKKGKKGDKKSSRGKLDIDDKSLDDEDDEVSEPVFAGKKKSKGKKSGGTSSFGFGLLGEGDEDGGDEDEENEVTGVEDSEEEDVSFAGKKKKSSQKGGKRGGSLFSASAFEAIDDGEDDGEVVDKDEEKDDDDDDISGITFSGKKKKSSKSTKKSDNKFSMALLDDEETEEGASVSETVASTDGKELDDDEDGSSMAFTGKKKSSKKKGTANKSNSKFATLVDVIENEQPTATESIDSKVNKNEDVAEPSKNKKKKKKGGRTVQEEDDLDKILAELGVAPSDPKTSAPPPPTEEKVQVQPEPVVEMEEKDGEDEKEESAAAKKKRKKKEKEKEKKAAAAAATAGSSEVKGGKVEEAKKLPKHIREKQELLARRQELEEKMRKEAEEKLRKEEEERLRLEELERQAEEAKRRKKEREKEKILKKKQEGKYLTAKQKLEQQRAEAFKKQILGNNASLVIDKDAAPAKRPIYKNKKQKPAHKHENGEASAVNAEEDKEIKAKEAEEDVEEKVEDVETETVEEKVEVADGTKENGVEVEDDDDDDEWDAKSWDDVNLNVKGAFDDEEVESEPEPIAKKDAKTVMPASNAAPVAVAAKTPASSQVNKVQDVQSRKSQPQTGKKGSVSAKNGGSSSDAPAPEENLRSPICCIMGHVDTGKTKLLDCIRGTNVQEGEAGGITQQIGATYFPAENIRERTRELKADAKLKVPGLLVIDTPGHESFTNLRSRGSGLCDIAILVVDIMHGLEPQTIESLNLLRMRNTEFIVALNKVDRLYGWKVCKNQPIVKAMKQQTKDVQNEFNMRLAQIVTEFQEQGLNTALYYKNKEMGETYSIVPTSAISGEGIPDLLLLLVQWTQKTMVEKLTFSNEMQCTVLEVKVIEGHGTTIDVVLVNGVLHEGDQIVVCGLQACKNMHGPIVTTIRALLTPHPMKELRVKGTYLHHKEIKAAQGIKISAQGLEHAIAGTGLYVVGADDDLEDVKESAMEDMKSVMSRIDRSGEGVYVQASTLGSLEALLEFLKSPAVKIPVSGIGIGPVHKKDVMKASVMLEKKKEYATILAFDVKVTPEARELADESGVKIFIADIIYHLFDQFKAYIDDLKEEKKKDAADEAVFPCVLKIMPNCVFNKKDPIVLGVNVVEGIAKVGTPICIPSQDFIDIGRISSIENNHKPVDTAKKGQVVAIKIIGSNSEEQQKMYGRHFDIEDELVSHISRKSIDLLKENYRDDLSNEEWRLVVKLKNIFKIQ